MINPLRKLLDAGSEQAAQRAVSALEATQAELLGQLDRLNQERPLLALDAEAGDEDAAARLDAVNDECAQLKGALDRKALALETARARVRAGEVKAQEDTRHQDLKTLHSMLKQRVERATRIGEALDAIAGDLDEMERLGDEIVDLHKRLGGRPIEPYFARHKVWRRISLHVRDGALANYLDKLELPLSDSTRLALGDSEAVACAAFDLPDGPAVPEGWSPALDPAIRRKL